jgi:soluble lytic murein transglycosylase-like protein
MDIRYYVRLVRSVFGAHGSAAQWRVRAAVALPSMFVLFMVSFAAFRVPRAIGSSTGSDERTAADQLMVRAKQVHGAFEHVEGVYKGEVQPLARVIERYRSDTRLARRVATALVREGRRANVPADMLLGVMLVENPWINPSARSPVGARGLMQVMPGHRGQWKQCPHSLEDIESNICYGAQIFRSYLREEGGQVETALLRYNGCVHGTNTPNCRAYPSAVFAHVGRATLNPRRPARTVSD